MHAESLFKPYDLKLTLSQALFFGAQAPRSEVAARIRHMAQLNISEVAREVGLRPSAIRYYERIGYYEGIGLLPPAERKSKQRRYDTALYRLAIIQRARQLGFTLDEIRQLFFGFGAVARASERWQQLCRRKLAELDELMNSLKAVQRLLKKVMQNCRCETLDQCGKGIFRSAGGNFPVKPLPASRRPTG